VVIINHGRLRFAGPLGDLGGGVVSVRVSEVDRLRDALSRRGLEVTATGESGLSVRGITAEEVGRVAVEERIVLSGLNEAGASLEATFLDLVRTDPSATTR
jgi:ABC-2 type transport system ATP-binding protein